MNFVFLPFCLLIFRFKHFGQSLDMTLNFQRGVAQRKLLFSNSFLLASILQLLFNFLFNHISHPVPIFVREILYTANALLILILVFLRVQLSCRSSFYSFLISICMSPYYLPTLNTMFPLYIHFWSWKAAFGTTTYDVSCIPSSARESLNGFRSW